MVEGTTAAARTPDPTGNRKGRLASIRDSIENNLDHRKNRSERQLRRLGAKRVLVKEALEALVAVGRGTKWYVHSCIHRYSGVSVESKTPSTTPLRVLGIPLRSPPDKRANQAAPHPEVPTHRSHGGAAQFGSAWMVVTGTCDAYAPSHLIEGGRRDLLAPKRSRRGPGRLPPLGRPLGRICWRSVATSCCSACRGDRRAQASPRAAR
jgi:hypothetical protein